MARLLVCVDLSPQTDGVVNRARWLASRLDAELWLLHVAPPEPEFVGLGPGPAAARDQMAETLHREHRQTQEIANRLSDAGLTATPLVVQGPTVDRILEHADRLDADLIVIGSRGHSVVYEVVVGSVAHDLLKRTTRPVLVVPPSER